jgi:hypothetical protein
MRTRLICAMPAAIGLAAFVLMTAPAAHAADPSFCRGYATAALNQVRGGLSNPRCAVGMQGARWSSEFNVHYEWCLGASFTATGTERDARTAYLRACR